MAAWLILESASLSALVARDCCRAHRVENSPAASSDGTTAGRRCHEPATATHCPMHAAAQPVCPMDEGASSDSQTASNREACVMRGVCSGPMATLAALMTQNGVLPDSTGLSFDDQTSPGAPPTAAHPILRSSSPETPPPKAFPTL